MFVVTVTCEINPEHIKEFRAAILKNANASITNEPGCRQFDVCFAAGGARCFLFEVYDDSDAFDAHRATPHFKQYSETVNDWIVSKNLETWSRATEPD